MASNVIRTGSSLGIRGDWNGTAVVSDLPVGACIEGPREEKVGAKQVNGCVNLYRGQVLDHLKIALTLPAQYMTSAPRSARLDTVDNNKNPLNNVGEFQFEGEKRCPFILGPYLLTKTDRRKEVEGRFIPSPTLDDRFREFYIRNIDIFTSNGMDVRGYTNMDTHSYFCIETVVADQGTIAPVGAHELAHALGIDKEEYKINGPRSKYRLLYHTGQLAYELPLDDARTCYLDARAR